MESQQATVKRQLDLNLASDLHSSEIQTNSYVNPFELCTSVNILERFITEMTCLGTSEGHLGCILDACKLWPIVRFYMESIVVRHKAKHSEK